jgi:hypothetical protein
VSRSVGSQLECTAIGSKFRKYETKGVGAARPIAKKWCMHVRHPGRHSFSSVPTTPTSCVLPQLRPETSVQVVTMRTSGVEASFECGFVFAVPSASHTQTIAPSLWFGEASSTNYGSCKPMLVGLGRAMGSDREKSNVQYVADTKSNATCRCGLLIQRGLRSCCSVKERSRLER